MCEGKRHRHRDQKDRHHLKNIEHLFFSARPGQLEQKKPAIDYPWRLKYCTARSCFSAAARVLNVPRFLRLPVLASTFPGVQPVFTGFQFPNHATNTLAASSPLSNWLFLVGALMAIDLHISTRRR